MTYNYNMFSGSWEEPREFKTEGRINRYKSHIERTLVIFNKFKIKLKNKL